MNSKQLKKLLEAKQLTFDEVAGLSSRTRVSIGLPPIIPQVDYSGFQRIMDSILPQYAGLRRMFGLDQDIVLDPVFNIGDDGGKVSQFYNRNLLLNNQRPSLYTMVEEMDTYDLINAALDLYAEEATQQDPETQRVLWIECDNEMVRSTLMDLMTRLQMDDKAFSIIRTMCKFGDDFEQIITSNNVGVTSLLYVHPARLTRVEDKQGYLQGFTAGMLSTEDSTWENMDDAVNKVSNPWDFVHFRLQSNNRESRHGDPIMLGARRAYQQLKMMEDMLVQFRLSRGMDRDVYYVNTAGQTQTQGWRNVHEFRQEVRKRLGLNPGVSMRQEFNPRTPDEDLFLPLNGPNDPTRVERQAGTSPQGSIEDVDHFRRKLLGALRIPAGFIGFEADTPAKATLASQYPRFARAIKRIQRSFKQGIRWICETHLIKKNIQTRDEFGRMAIKYTVKMAPIDQLEETAKLELYQARVGVVQALLNMVSMQQQPDPRTGLIIPQSGLLKNIDDWTGWVLRNFLKCTDSEVGLFLGNPNAGLTVDAVEMKNLTERAKKDHGAKFKVFIETAEGIINDIRDTGEQVDENFVPITESRDFDLNKVENDVARQLNHSTEDNPYIVKCPSCKEHAMKAKYDSSCKTTYMLCECGHVTYPDQNSLVICEDVQ